MASLQTSVLSVSSLSNLATSTASSTSSRVTVKAWTRPTARRGFSIRAEYQSPEKGGAMSPAPPSTPPGVSGTEVPLGVYTSTAPLEQKNVPKGQRMAYICQDCGYIYDLDTPFEEQDDATYACPVCTAPKASFVPANATLDDEPYDVTKGGPANSGPDSKKSQNMN
ncbi:hypothetical protein Mapa_002288 [Marchantia paleacea]|nr:hypothetical protein Mapa_002288 [Marchantia paleacea]